MFNQEIYHDKDGQEYILDENGNKIPPLVTSKSTESNGWREYDTSQGHCGLCGRLTCNGTCFK